jgi:hypothetical protein
MGYVPTRNWKDPEYRKGITKKILESDGRTGFDESFYDIQNTMKDDAAKCYQSHGRPAYKSNTQPKCGDYLSHNKEIKPDTSKERKSAGIGSYDDSKVRKSYICEFCPYHQSVRSELQK